MSILSVVLYKNSIDKRVFDRSRETSWTVNLLWAFRGLPRDVGRRCQMSCRRTPSLELDFSFEQSKHLMLFHQAPLVPMNPKPFEPGWRLG
jgi:hypothetical protein